MGLALLAGRRNALASLENISRARLAATMARDYAWAIPAPPVIRLYLKCDNNLKFTF